MKCWRKRWKTMKKTKQITEQSDSSKEQSDEVKQQSEHTSGALTPRCRHFMPNLKGFGSWLVVSVFTRARSSLKFIFLVQIRVGSLQVSRLQILCTRHWSGALGPGARWRQGHTAASRLSSTW